MRPSLLAAVGAFGLTALMQHGHPVPDHANNYIALAQAWLHGHAWITFPRDQNDAVPFHGRAYVVEGPVPAILLLPFVAVLGGHASQALLANVLGAVAVFAMFALCERVGISLRTTIAATAFAFFGTSLYTCATQGSVWFLAHVCAFAFTMLAIEETMGHGRGWLVALYAAAAAFSRFPLATTIPLYAIALGVRASGMRRVASYFAALVPSFVLSTWYNLVRWGTVGDPGYALWYRLLDDRYRPDAPMFSLANARGQIATFIGTFPGLSRHVPFIVVPNLGFSLVATSLPFAYAVFAGPGVASVLLAIAFLATAIPAFTYYDDGQYQFGMRHALDFEPFLFALLVLALKRRPARWMVVALVVFALLGAIEGTLWLHPPHAS